MINLLQYEIRKLLKNRKNRYILLIAIVFLVFSYFYILNKHQSYIEDRIQILNQDSNYASRMVDYIEAYPDNLNPMQLRFWEDEANYAHKLKQYYSFPGIYDWQTAVSFSIERDMNLIVGYEMQFINHSVYSTEVYVKTLQQQIEVNKHLLDHNIEPLSSPYYPNGLNTLNMLLSKEMILILFTFIVIFFLDVLSAEMESGFFKTLYTSRFKRPMILFTKLIVSCVFALMISLCFITIIFFMTSLRHGFGNPLYPIAIFDQNSTTEMVIIPLQTYVSYGYLHVGVHLLAIISFMALIYFIAMDTTVTFSILISMFIFLYIIGFNASGLANGCYFPLASYDYALIMKSQGFDKMALSNWLTLIYGLFSSGISLFRLKAMDIQGETHS